MHADVAATGTAEAVAVAAQREAVMEVSPMTISQVLAIIEGGVTLHIRGQIQTIVMITLKNSKVI